MNGNLILFLIVVLLVAGDKVTTYYSLHNLQKNNPNFDYLKAERNLAARFFLGKFGLIWGNVLYGLISIATFYIAIYCLQAVLSMFGVKNFVGISWYVMFLIYSLVIANNTYFLLKHGRILP